MGTIPQRDPFAVRPRAYRYEPQLGDDDEGSPRRFFVSGYGGLSIRLGSLAGKAATFTGIRGGLMFGRRFSIGGAYYGVRNRFGSPIRDLDGNRMLLDVAYGGVTVGVSVALWKRGELELKGLLGGGSACIGYVHAAINDLPFGCVERVALVAVEPGATVYFNAAPWIRFGLEVGYRFVGRNRWSPPNHFRISGPYGGLSAEFGWFKKPRR